MLKKSTEDAWNRDNFAQRMALYNIAADEISINPSVVPQSVAGETRILDDYPALLSYALFEIFVHARLAQDFGADPTAIVNRFRERENRLWIRWLALAEDLPLGTSLFFQAAEHGLISWMAVMDRCQTGLSRALRVEFMLTLSRGRSASLPQDANIQCSNRYPQFPLPARTYTTVDTIYPKLTCECESCSLIFTAMIQAAKKRNVSALECLSRYSEIGTLYRDLKQDTILHILARISDSSLLHAYLHNTAALAERGTGKLHTFLPGAKQRAFRPVQRNENGQAPLLIAVVRENVQNVSELLKYGFEPDVTDSKHRRPLHLACSNMGKGRSRDISENSLKIAALLLEAGAQINTFDLEGHTPLHSACLNIPEFEPPRGEVMTAARAVNDTRPDTSPAVAEVVELLDDIDSSTSPNIVKMVELLLSHGANVASKSNVEPTPLHLACASGTTWRESCPNTLAVVKRLLDAGADPRATTTTDETPLHIAAARSSRGVAAELIRRGASIMARDLLLQTPLHHAAWAGNNPVAEEMFAADDFDPIWINSVDARRSTPLHFACQFYDERGDEETRERSLKLMRNLLECGAQVYEPKNWIGLSQFEVAQQRWPRLDDVLHLLREFGGDPPTALSDKGWALLRRVGKAIRG